MPLEDFFLRQYFLVQYMKQVYASRAYLHCDLTLEAKGRLRMGRKILRNRDLFVVPTVPLT